MVDKREVNCNRLSRELAQIFRFQTKLQNLCSINLAIVRRQSEVKRFIHSVGKKQLTLVFIPGMPSPSTPINYAIRF